MNSGRSPSETDREIAIIGAGAVGLTAGFELACESVDVTVYERGTVASGSSGRAAGICYDAFASRTDAILGREALDRFHEFADEGAPFESCPYVWLAREGDTEQVESIRKGIEQMQSHGIEAVEIPPDELKDRFPSLRVEDIAVAGITENAGYIDTADYTEWLAETAREAGVRIETETPVEIGTAPPRIVDDDGTEREVDAVLVAAGAHSKQILAAAGISIAMKPYRVQALVATATVDVPMWYDATGDCYARPHPAGLLAGDGTENREADPDAYNRDANPEFPEELAKRLDHRMPSVSLDLQRAWAGLCTATPDRNPLVGELRDGVYVATGFQGQGFMRSPAIGRHIAAEMLGEHRLDPYDPTRFTGEEEFAVHEGMAIEPETDGEKS